MQHVHDQTSSDVRSRTCRRLILPRVLSSHEEATVRCAKARPGSNSSTGSKAPVRLTTSGPHVLAKLSKLDPVFIDRCDARGVMQNSSHLINVYQALSGFARFTCAFLVITVSVPMSQPLCRLSGDELYGASI